MPAVLEKPSLIWTKDELVAMYLFGVKLTDDRGTPYSDLMFENWIASAQRTVERELDITLTPRHIVDEKHAFVPWDFRQWGHVNLFCNPIIKVTRFQLKFPAGGDTVYEFPTDWITWDENPGSGRVQIVPATAASMPQMLAAAGFNLLSYGNRIIPDMIRVDYDAGLTHVPPDIRHIVGMLASIDILNIAGDMLGGAGVASRSLSIGGLSSSVSTTSSPSFAGYGARIIQYNKQIKEMYGRIKADMGRHIRMTVA